MRNPTTSTRRRAASPSPSPTITTTTTTRSTNSIINVKEQHKNNGNEKKKTSSSSKSSSTSGGGTSRTTTTTKTTPCCSKVGMKRGPWTPEEDEVLSKFIQKEGEGRWRTLPKRAGLLRCGKSCRLRWMNYLRPSVKRGHIAPDEEDLILRLHRLLGNRWSLIAGRIPGRTDNEIKNYWNTHLSKKLISQGIDPRTHKPLNHVIPSSSPPPPPPPPHHHQPHLNSKLPAAAAASNYNIIPLSSKTINNPPAAAAANPKTGTTSSTAPTIPPANPTIIVTQDPPTTTTTTTTSPASTCGFFFRHQIINPNNNIENGGCSYFHGTAPHHIADDHHDLGAPYQSARSASQLQAHCHAAHLPPCSDCSALGNLTCTGLHITEDDHDDHEEDFNYCSEDVFSSFLNSLINDDAFAAQHHLQVQQTSTASISTPIPPTPSSSATAPPLLSDPLLSTSTSTAPSTTHSSVTTWEPALLPLSSPTLINDQNDPKAGLNHHGQDQLAE